MKKILFLIICTYIFYYSLAQNVTFDTTIAGRSYRKAKSMLENRQFNKFDSILNYSNYAAERYSKYRIWPGLLNCLCNQIEVYARQNDEKKTKEIFDSILVINRKLPGSKYPYLANAYHYLGLLNFYKGNYDLALGNFFTSLKIREKLYGGKTRGAAQTYNTIGIVYEGKSILDTALIYYQKALEIIKEQAEETHIFKAMLYNNIANIYTKKKDYYTALDYQAKALEIRKELFGEKNLEVALSYSNISVTYSKMPDIPLALEYSFKAINIYKDLSSERYIEAANTYRNIGFLYTLIPDIDKSIEYYSKALEIFMDLFGERNVSVAESHKTIALLYIQKAEYNKALEHEIKRLEISKELFGEISPEVAACYNDMGRLYYDENEYTISQEYLLKSLEINKKLLGENDVEVARNYLNIGSFYYSKSEYDKCLEYFLKSLEIFKNTIGEINPDVGEMYMNIGVAYKKTGELNKALEFLLKSLEILKTAKGEKSDDVASSLNNIGTVYEDIAENENEEYKNAMQYYQNSLDIFKELHGEKYSNVARGYYNLGHVYNNMGDYESAIRYLMKSLEIRKEVFGEINTDLAESYNLLGVVNLRKKDYSSALDAFTKALTVYKTIWGHKHAYISVILMNIGFVYQETWEPEKALEFYQKAICANIVNFNDSLNVNSNPILDRYLEYHFLLNLLKQKAIIYEQLADSLPYSRHVRELSFIHNFSNYDLYNKALENYVLCDSIIDFQRKKMSGSTDKISMGKYAAETNENAIRICLKLGKMRPSSTRYYNEHAFYFSEQNKNIILLQALAGQEGLKFAGIPDSLLQKEHLLKVDMAFYEKKLAEKSDSTTEVFFRNKLFVINRQYEGLINAFEKNYPGYFNLKYSTKKVSVKDIQNILDNKTAIRSYFMGDSNNFIFTLTKKKLEVYQVPISKNLNDSITWFRYGLTKTSPRMKEYYRRLGFFLYQQTFPGGMEIEKGITNLIIIPDGPLAIIPFESLLTENYSGDIDSYSEYPYLIKKFNISYSYSANLFHLTFSREVSSPIEITKLNDWLAFAPIFDKTGDQNLSISTRKLKKQLTSITTDSIVVSRSMFNRNFISPLPATEAETENILKLYDDNNLKAKVLLHNDANEEKIKSGELEQYKVIHFATHGFVNSEKPELSGLILAQDTSGSEDGVLYSGEIYNLKLNADLVVLSACETGLGKIQKGEGIIGLTRALLYAGVKNIIVSLWEVADKSTSDLMVDFYKNSLTGNKQQSYSEALRNAKLKMISEGGEFAHPLFWSPFILIGK